MAGKHPEDHNQNEKQRAAAIQQDTIASFAGFVKFGSIKQSHSRLSSQSRIRYDREQGIGKRE
jgi:hypothetical protein